jgi:hypothetical protein
VQADNAMIYLSKKDLWIVLLVLPISLLLLGVGLFLLLLVVTQAAPWPAMIPGLILSGVGGLILWAMLSTSCEITSSDLIVRFGPVRFRIRLDAIAQVIPKTGYSAEATWGLAWSLDRVVIKLRRKVAKWPGLEWWFPRRRRIGFLRSLPRRWQG